MDTLENLRNELTAYVRKKFRTRPNIFDISDEIVNQAFLDMFACQRHLTKLTTTSATCPSPVFV